MHSEFLNDLNAQVICQLVNNICGITKTFSRLINFGVCAAQLNSGKLQDSHIDTCLSWNCLKWLVFLLVIYRALKIKSNMSIYHPEQNNYLSDSYQPYIGENMHMTMA